MSESDPHEKMRRKALSILAAIGDTVAGRTADGAVYGDLDNWQPRPQIRRGQRTRWSKLPELAPLMELSAGQLVRVTPPDGVTAQKLQSVVCALACNKWGKGNYTTVMNGDSVDVIRTA